jgi:hypothetical protein
VKLAAGHITRDADAESLLEAVESFVIRILASEITAVELTDDCPWFGGQRAVEFKDVNTGWHCMGLKSSFENLP